MTQAPLSTDLVSRLRTEAFAFDNHWMGSEAKLLREAADELERQRITISGPPDWQPIETAPKGAHGYSWMRLKWGAEGDQSSGDGMRWGDRFFAAATFHRLGQEQRFQMEIIEVKPTHWMPSTEAPSHD